MLWESYPLICMSFWYFRALPAAERSAQPRNHAVMLIVIAAAVSVIAADQASKAFIMSRSWAADSNTGFLLIRRRLTRRGPLMLSLARPILVVFWIISAAIAVVLLQTGVIAQNIMNAACVGAALGGAAGNIVDRLRRGAIVDFIAIGRWPPFNLADAAIVVGVVLLVLSFAKG